MSYTGRTHDSLVVHVSYIFRAPSCRCGPAETCPNAMACVGADSCGGTERCVQPQGSDTQVGAVGRPTVRGSWHPASAVLPPPSGVLVICNVRPRATTLRQPHLLLPDPCLLPPGRRRVRHCAALAPPPPTAPSQTNKSVCPAACAASWMDQSSHLHHRRTVTVVAVATAAASV